MSSEQEGEYLLSHNALASARLTYQHHMLIARQGYLLHPTIKAAVQASNAPLEILDLATGNGIWLTELAHEWKQHRYLGLDISTAQFPPRSSWAHNVVFDTMDFLADVPQEYIARFDIVHVRFIFLILWQSPDRRVTALDNMKKMLKPGGWLQWQDSPPPIFATFSEPDEGGLCTWNTDVTIPVLKSVEKFTGIYARSMYLNELDMFVKESGGFENVEAHWPLMRRDRALHEGELYIWGWEEIKHGFFKLPHMTEEDKEELTEVHRRFFEELKSGDTLIGFRAVVVVAQKQAGHSNQLH